MIDKRILIYLGALQLLHQESNAQEKCNCNPVGSFPAIINGITVTEKASGDVTHYGSTLKHCDLNAGPTWLGQAKNFTYTINFSAPVNHVEYVLNSSNIGESFTFTVSNGALNASQGCGSCPYTQSGNKFTTKSSITEDLSMVHYYITSAGIITLSSTLPYTSITISGPGGGNGTLMGICINSISSDNKGVPITMACNESGNDTDTFSGISSKRKKDTKQQTLTGKWTGSNMKGTKSELEIIQDGNKIKGFENIRFSDGSEALYSISGSIHGDQVEWTEDDPFPFEANLVSNIILCKTHNTFSLIHKNEKLYLAGTHTSIDKKPECNGISGDYCYVQIPAIVKNSVAGTTAPVKTRKVIPVANIKLPEKEFTIIIWDDRTEDGDIVTLFLNGVPVLEHYTLQNAPKEIALVCPDGENELIMQAESMGTSPPNTAAIKIQCGDKIVKRLVLKSTDKTSQSLIIKSK